jgi:ATP-dependent helicase/nuclease subunit B
MAGAAVTTKWAAPGRATVAAVAAAVRDLQGANRLRSVLVVTPPGSTATTLRRLLPSIDGTGIAGIRFTTLPDLALDLAPADVRLRRPITPLLLTAAVNEELTLRCPGPLAAVKDHPATVDALVQAADRLGAVALAPDRAEVTEGLVQGSDVRRAMVAVALAARRAIEAKGFRDEAAVLAATGAALAAGTATVPAPVVVVASDAFHPAQVPFLVTVLGAAPAATVVGTPVAPTDGDLAAQLQRITGQTPPTIDVREPDRVVSCPDHDEEVRWVVRTIVGRVTGSEAISPEELMVLHPPGSAHARSLRDELERAGLASSGPTIETLAGSTAGQAVRLLLDAFDEGCDREHVLHVVAVAPEWPFGDRRRRNAARWRRLCREAGVVTASDWQHAVDKLAAAQQARRERAAAADPAIDPAQPTDRDTWDLEAMATLVGLAQRLSLHATTYRRARTWADATEVLAAALAEHIGTDEWRELNWADAPVWQRRAAEQVGTLLAAVRQFDEPATPLAFGRTQLRRVVDTELDRKVRRAGDTTQGVRVLPLHHGICLDARTVFVVGANDGLLPPSRRDDLVVPRELPEACAAVIEHADWHRQRLRRAWDATLAAGAEVVVTHARTDLRRGGAVYPSTWIAGIEPEVHASHAAGLRTMPVLTAAEAAARRGTGDATAAPALQRRAIALTSRTAPDATEFDGWLGPHPEHDPREAVQAITRFESHAKCGLSYFIERVLKVDTGTDPSEITEIEPLTKGNLVHRVMERLVGDWLALDPATRPEWLQGPHLEASTARAVEILDEEAAHLAAGNLLGHPHAWAIERELIVSALTAALQAEAAARLTPLAVELAFGFPDSDTPAFEVEIDELGVVRFWGRVDRVDCTDTELLVTDFKTSRAATKPSIKAADVREGKRLQLPLYAKVVAGAAASLGVDGELPARSRYVYLRRDTSEEVPFKAEFAEAFDVIVPHTARRMATGDFRPSAPDEWGSPVLAPDGLGLGDIAARAGLWHTAPVFPDDEPRLLETEALS